MRIERIHVDAFGKLHDLDTGATALGSLVVVLGPNEAGKSTLFSFLTTALYGFHPASRDRNPHVPWGADEASGRVVLRLSGSGCAVVERRLRSAPSARLTRGDATEELRNQPLPWVEHVPRSVFEQVYAVTLADLAGLDEQTWGRIQDRVLGSMGASDLRPARDVADALEREAGEIWRPNRRGNQRLRDLRDRIRELRTRRSDALERDRRVRSLVEEIESVETHLRELRTVRQRDKIVVERVTELLPVKRALDRVEELRAGGGARAGLDALGADPGERLQELATERAQLRERLDATDQERAGLERALAAFDDRARALVGSRGAIGRFVVRAGEAASDRARAGDLRAEVEALTLRARAAAQPLLEGPLDDETEGRLRSLPVELLADRVARLERLERARADAPSRVSEGSDPEPRLAHPTLILTLVGGGSALTVWGLTSEIVVAAVAGAAFVGVGVALAIAARARGPKASPPSDERTRGGEERTGLRRELDAMLSGLALRRAYTDPPGAPLVTTVTTLRSLLEERRQRRAALDAVLERLAGVDAEASDLATALERTEPESAEALADELARELEGAELAASAAARAEGALTDLRRDREDLSRRLAYVESEAETLRLRVEEITGLRGEEALREAVRRLEAHREADRIEEGLGRSHPDLDDIRRRIGRSESDVASWSVGDLELAERKQRLEELDAEIEERAGFASRLERDAAHLREEETVDAVDSEIATLREIERELVRERDRKWILAHLAREADRRFREEHQPDLVRRASEYLARLTANRYDRLLVDERGDGDLFRLVGPGLPAPVPLSRPISTGTLEQAYLSLRLAIVDHLDQDREPLPLFIDEGFVNWDADRRDRGLSVLAEVSERRQVFAFTCHPEMADRLATLGACVVGLP